MITVRKATATDKPQIFEFIRAAHPELWPHLIPQRWEWEFGADRYHTEDNSLPVIVAVDETSGNVVGQVCALHVRAQLNGRIVPVAWGADILVLPAHRGLTGVKLQQANQRANPILLALNIEGGMRTIFERMGAVPLTPVLVLERMVRYQPRSVEYVLAERIRALPQTWRKIAASFVRSTRIANVLAIALNSRLRMRRLRARRAYEANIAIEPFNTFDDEFERCWQQLSTHFGAAIVRDAEYMNWRFCRQPQVRYDKYKVRRDGVMIGYLIVRAGRPPEPNTGYIIELAVQPEQTAAIQSTIEFAIERLASEGVDKIEFASTVRSYQRAAVSLRFNEIRYSVPLCYCSPEVERPEALINAEWFLSKGDCDWDFFPMG